MSAKVARQVIGVAVALAAALLGITTPAAAAIPSTTECVTEQYAWAGQAALQAGESFDTGVAVPAQLGTQLAVTSVDVTSDGDASVVALRIGEATAVAGAAVPGGDIVAVNGGPEAMVITTVGVVVQRCHEVAQAGAGVVVPDTQAATGGSSGTPLPNTGSTTPELALLAGGCTAAGVVLRSTARRRRIA